MTDREILIAAINRQMQQAPERVLYLTLVYLRGWGYSDSGGETKTAQRAKKAANRENGG